MRWDQKGSTLEKLLLHALKGRLSGLALRLEATRRRQRRRRWQDSFGFPFEWDCKDRAAIVAIASVAFPIRHGCGYALANPGHDTRAIQAWMGHKTPVPGQLPKVFSDDTTSVETLTWHADGKPSCCLYTV
jgi:type 1 fimbriae regulatory protein FimB/type 1 fimbriae regulatory protein FimE